MGMVWLLAHAAVVPFGVLSAPPHWYAIGASGAVVVWGLLSFRANRRAAAMVRAHRHLLMLRRAARLLEVRIPDLAPLLGAIPRELRQWKRTGVPSAQEDGVVRLLHTTVALRRELPAGAARCLLTLRSQHIAAFEENWLHVTVASHRDHNRSTAG